MNRRIIAAGSEALERVQRKRERRVLHRSSNRTCHFSHRVNKCHLNVISRRDFEEGEGGREGKGFGNVEPEYVLRIPRYTALYLTFTNT